VRIWGGSWGWTTACISGGWVGGWWWWYGTKKREQHGPAKGSPSELFRSSAICVSVFGRCDTLFDSVTRWPSRATVTVARCGGRRTAPSGRRNMRGLPFPPNALFDRENTSEVGSPFSNVDDIPIDPALAGTPVTDHPHHPHSHDLAQVNTAITAKAFNASRVIVICRPSRLTTHFDQDHPLVPNTTAVPARTRHYSQEPSQYDKGPRGDPFAPQLSAAYIPVPEPIPQAPKPQKRKRKPRREEECGFCQGNDSKNKHGHLEPMVSCEECGRSGASSHYYTTPTAVLRVHSLGHPSCMELGGVADVVRSYPWKCIECKTCEICLEKGDDVGHPVHFSTVLPTSFQERILFCDFCDRGMDQFDCAASFRH